MKKLLLIAALMFAVVGCSEYDDSEIRGRMDEMDEKLDAHEAWLAQLDSQIKGLNNAYAAFTDLLNGGIVSGVTPITEEPGGYKLTIKYGDGTTETYDIYNGTTGEQGDKYVPEFTVKADADGRLYWLVDGEPVDDGNGGYVYATGDVGPKGPEGPEGPKGPQGDAPELKIDASVKSPGEDAWWYRFGDGEWTEIGIFQGNITVASGVSMTIEEGKVVFTQGSDKWVFPIGGDVITISVEAGENLRFYKGETKTFPYTIANGADREYIIKAEPLTNDGVFSVTYDDKNIYVTANKVGEDLKNYINVEVIEKNSICYHTYFDVAADIPTFTISEMYRGIIFDYDATSGNKDFEIALEVDMTPQNYGKLIEPKIIGSNNLLNVHSDYSSSMGEDGNVVYCYIEVGSSIADATFYNEVVQFVPADGMLVHFEDDIDKCNIYCYKSASSLALQKVTLQSNMVNISSVSGGDGTGIAGLIDDDLATYWHSTYSNSKKIDEEYGIYIDIDMSTVNNPFSAFQYKWAPRQNNMANPPYMVNLYVSTDNGTTWELSGLYVRPEESMTAGIKYSTGVYGIGENSNVNKLRFSIIQSGNTNKVDLRGQMDVGSYVCALGTLEVHILNQ